MKPFDVYFDMSDEELLTSCVQIFLEIEGFFKIIEISYSFWGKKKFFFSNFEVEIILEEMVSHHQIRNKTEW